MSANPEAGRGAVPPLPSPVTANDVYLHALVTELRAVRRLLEGEPVKHVELREPATDTRLTCKCGRVCKSPAGLAKHRAACEES